MMGGIGNELVLVTDLLANDHAGSADLLAPTSSTLGSAFIHMMPKELKHQSLILYASALAGKMADTTWQHAKQGRTATWISMILRPLHLLRA